MRALPLSLALALLGGAVSAEDARGLRSALPGPGTMVSPDELTRTIMRQQIAGEGFRMFAAPKKGPPIELKLEDLSKPGTAKAAPAKPAKEPGELKTLPELKRVKKAAPAKGKPAVKASEQLPLVEKEGWGEPRKDRAAEPDRRKEPDAEIL